jgi:hypothetical protein
MELHELHQQNKKNQQALLFLCVVTYIHIYMSTSLFMSCNQKRNHVLCSFTHPINKNDLANSWLRTRTCPQKKCNMAFGDNHKEHIIIKMRSLKGWDQQKIVDNGVVMKCSLVIFYQNGIDGPNKILQWKCV